MVADKHKKDLTEIIANIHIYPKIFTYRVN